MAANATQLFAILPDEPVPEAAGDRYATVQLRRQRQGLALAENDLWIAVTTLALSAGLVSRDSDVQQIDGLLGCRDSWAASRRHPHPSEERWQTIGLTPTRLLTGRK